MSIENNDLWGNRSVLDRVGPGQVFAETYACVPGEALMVSVVAAETAQVLFLDAAQLLLPCQSACSHHARLIANLLSISAQKNLNLSRRIFHTSSKSIRGRLLSYLSYQALRQGSRDFTIPFDRQALADYLSVDRSALSAELGKMQREGLLRVRKNHFVLLSSRFA
ncbi:Crp/Fnr family transcriptional regulator [Oscillibacter sp.]|uniref:Crp/Fnr family transcriptional regulator n=1 Tax=Oscillibacter sp. TaxID=1945593 RepID=UPI00345C3F24